MDFRLGLGLGLGLSLSMLLILLVGSFGLNRLIYSTKSWVEVKLKVRDS